MLHSSVPIVAPLARRRLRVQSGDFAGFHPVSDKPYNVPSLVGERVDSFVPRCDKPYDPNKKTSLCHR
jgi:hypothetical protein